MNTLDTQVITDKLDRLIRICDTLADENYALRQQQLRLVAEQSELIEKLERAQSRIEAILARLQAMEVDS